MELIVNGAAHQIPEGSTVAQLLDVLQVKPERVVVEVNLTILKRAQHPTTTLKTGDRVEIVQLVGGGSVRPQTSDVRRPSGVWGLEAGV